MKQYILPIPYDLDLAKYIVERIQDCTIIMIGNYRSSHEVIFKKRGTTEDHTAIFKPSINTAEIPQVEFRTVNLLNQKYRLDAIFEDKTISIETKGLPGKLNTMDISFGPAFNPFINNLSIKSKINLLAYMEKVLKREGRKEVGVITNTLNQICKTLIVKVYQ